MEINPDTTNFDHPSLIDDTPAACNDNASKITITSDQVINIDHITLMDDNSAACNQISTICNDSTPTMKVEQLANLLCKRSSSIHDVQKTEFYDLIQSLANDNKDELDAALDQFYQKDNSNGYTYVGEYHEGKKHGKGVEVTNGNKFDGTWLKNEKNGEFKETYANGDTYVGEYARNKKTGSGVFTKKTGESYQGMWLKDKYHGKGKWTSADGKSYFEGEFVKGKRTNGQVLEAKPNGEFFEGELTGGRPINGYVKEYYNGKLSYEGELQGGKHHGQGVWYNPWCTYKGNFENGCMNGQGTLTKTNGEVHSGEWVKEHLNGIPFKHL